MALALGILGASPVGATGLPQSPPLATGAIVALAGTPHLWIADEGGVLHWAGDTRALAGRMVNWASRQEISLDQLRAMRRGDPWLSAGLLKSGDPIYFVKWESDWPEPQLLHIQSIQDVELFGIDGTNYGQMVLSESAWQQRFSIAPTNLKRGVLAGATAGTTTTAPTAAASTPKTETEVKLVAKLVQNTTFSNRTATHVIEVTGITPGARLKVSGSFDEYECSPSCTSTRKGSFPAEDAGAADSTGKLVWRRTHPWYSGARYTFEDPSGNKAIVDVGNDL